MGRSMRLMILIAALAATGLLAAACGTARDGEPAIVTTTTDVAPVEADNHDEDVEDHMEGVAAVSHEEGDGHAADLHGGAAVKTIEVVAYEWGFSPARLELPVGVPVRLVLKNEGLIEHEVQIPFAEAVEVIDEDGHGEAAHSTLDDHGTLKDGLIHVHAGPHQTSSKTFIVAAVGRYEYACEIPGHRAAGMVGHLEVEAHGS